MVRKKSPYVPKIKGCYQCSKRRINCDGAQPCCAKCASRGISCSGINERKFRNRFASDQTQIEKAKDISNWDSGDSPTLVTLDTSCLNPSLTPFLWSWADTSNARFIGDESDRWFMGYYDSKPISNITNYGTESSKFPEWDSYSAGLTHDFHLEDISLALSLTEVDSTYILNASSSKSVDRHNSDAFVRKGHESGS